MLQFQLFSVNLQHKSNIKLMDKKHKPKITLQDYDKYSYPLRELGWDIDEIIISQKEWEANHYTLFNHNVTREGIAI